LLNRWKNCYPARDPEQFRVVSCYIHMKKVIQIFPTLKLRLFTLMVFLSVAAGTLGQTPTHYPTGSNPVRFNLINILLFIVFPVLLVVLWIVIRQRGRSKVEDKDKE
jgi:hypothetical protein